MSDKKIPPSKFLSSFYSGANTSGSEKPSGQGLAKFQRPSTPTKSTDDVDKFKKPEGFFKSQTSSQNLSSQSRPAPAKRTSFGNGGSTHEMLSQSFQPKKPTMSKPRTTLPGRASGSQYGPASSQQGPKPSQTYPAQASASQSANRKPQSSQLYSQPPGSQSANLSSKPKQTSHPAQHMATHSSNHGPMSHPQPSTSHLAPKSSQTFNPAQPLTSHSANLRPSTSMPQPNYTFSNHQFPHHRKPNMDKNVASTKALELQWTTKMRHKTQVGGDKRSITHDVKSPMGKSCWADSSFSKTDAACKNQQNDPWYSSDVWGDDLSVEAVDECLRFATQAQKSAELAVLDDPLSSWMDESWASPVKMSPSPHKPAPSARTALFTEVRPKEDFMALLAGDDDFLALVDDVESSAGKSPLPRPSKLTSSNSFPPPRKPVPLSERMPMTGNKSFVIKAKEYESPNKLELTQSQRTLRKPTKSMPSPTTTKIGLTTDWLRGQLEKISTQYSTVKGDLEVKEGESKLLREKLRSAEEEVQKHKNEKVKELQSLREGFEKKVKLLEKQLEATQVQAMFKAKEAESSLEKYRELKSVSVRTPEPPPSGSFRHFTPGARPGEHRVLVDETVSTIDVINDTLLETQKKSECPVEGTPEKMNLPVREIDIASKCTDESTQVDLIFDGQMFRKNEVFARMAEQLVHGDKPKKEMNHFLMPPMEYLPHTLLQTEFSEHQVENYMVRRPTLVEHWGTTSDVFGEAVLDEYEKAAVGDVLPPDNAHTVLAKSRHFTTTESIHGVLLSLSNKTKWNLAERQMSKAVVDLATTMTRELYATLGDPRHLQTSYTIYDRDPKILSEFQNCSELFDQFDPLSPKKWKDEAYVELRRCLVIIGFLCSADHTTARYILNPKSHCHRDFHPPNVDSSQNLTRRSTKSSVALKIVLKEGERKPNELKLMQMYRDLHSKQLTLVCKLSLSLDSSSIGKARGATAQSKITASRSAIPRHSQLTLDVQGVKFDEFQRCAINMGVEVDGVAFEEFNPCKILQLKNRAEQIMSRPKVSILKKDWVTISRNLAAVQSVVVSDGSVLNAPADKCISALEKAMMELTFKNTQALLSRVQTSLEKHTLSDLDLTRYVPKSPDAWDKNRKRKVSTEDPGPSKIIKIDGYETPPFDTNLYSQIKQKPDDVVCILDSQTQLLPEDDQLAKFEKREEMAALKMQMLADEKIMEAKPSSSRHSLARLRTHGRTSPTSGNSADKEMVMEIEKMFQSQVAPDTLEESVWCLESDNDSDSPNCVSDDKVEIEFIPDLVKHFHHKLKHAGLLELLCEVFKEGGILRFTHRLSGVMLGTVKMLQKIVMYQRREVEPYCSKLATIIREILYMRPSPRIVFEVNVLLRHAVGVRGFTKMLCHNASPDTFVITVDQVYFTRGACLLEVICILVTYATEEATEHNIYLELVHWIHRIMVSEKKHMASLYEQHNSERRRCMCITALNNTVVMVFYRSLCLYRRLCETNSLSQSQPLKKLFSHSLQVLRLVYTYGSLSFLHSIKTQMLEYRQLLTWLRDMNSNSTLYDKFRLSKADAFVVEELLNDTRSPNPIPERPAEWITSPKWDRSKAEKHFTHYLHSDSSESEDE